MGGRIKITKVDDPNHVGITFMIGIPYIELSGIRAEFTGKIPEPSDIPDFLLELGVIAEAIHKELPTAGEEE